MRSYCSAKQITKGLWLCDIKAAEYAIFIDKYNIKYVINLSARNIKKCQGVKYINIPIKDAELGNIPFSRMKKIFDFCADLIHILQKNKINMIVNCKRGHHRSASMIVAYLIKYKKYTLKDAIHFIREKRPLALRGDRNIIKHLYLYYIDLSK